VAKAVGRDGRIGPKFLHPGPGYGGSCFPKDTQALAKIARDYDSPMSLVETTIAANGRQKIKMAKKIEDAFGGPGSLKGKTIAILGLAFKQNTDDMRDSPAITICEELVKRDARLRVWDPAAMKEALWYLESIKEKVFFASGEYYAMEGADGLAILTPWNQFRNLDLKKTKELLAHPYFFDFRNIYNRAEVESAGLRYFALGK
jgi:UDPglucose 6-dehydrogenase